MRTLVTIDQVNQTRPAAGWKPVLADRGRRRHMSYTVDFDTRCYLFEEPGEGWAEMPRRLHLENRERARVGLAVEFGRHGMQGSRTSSQSAPSRFPSSATTTRFLTKFGERSWSEPTTPRCSVPAHSGSAS
jgi:hypothetical protein